MMITTDGARWLWAAGSVAAYGVLCGAVYWRHKRQERLKLAQQSSLSSAETGASHAWVAYASQTGQAESLAWKTAEVLHGAGLSVQVLALDELDPAVLAPDHSLYVIASTYGEGDPPDNGARTGEAMARGKWTVPAGLPVSVLALGDSTYQQFCGFGRFVEASLLEAGARSLLPRVEVDQMADDTLQAWFDQVAEAVGSQHSVSWVAEPFDETGWTLASREHINLGSPGEMVCHLVLKPTDPASATWEAGDLVQVLPPGASQPRDYSIASIAADGTLDLLVRLRRLEDGSSVGLASGWLCQSAIVGQPVRLRLRSHAGFRIGDNVQRPLILIGNGTGLAGLRAHLKARALQWHEGSKNESQACWLMFGERSASADLHFRADLQHWQDQGVLARLDTAFSREVGGPRYVQECVTQCAEALRDWVARGAAIYVCGSLAGMASGVDEALRDALGDEAIDALSQSGRYRRDVY